MKTSTLCRDEGGRVADVWGKDEGGGIKADEGGGGIEADEGEGYCEGCVDRGEDVRFVMCIFGIAGDREGTGLGGTALSWGEDDGTNDFRGWREVGGVRLVGE